MLPLIYFTTMRKPHDKNNCIHFQVSQYFHIDINYVITEQGHIIEN